MEENAFTNTKRYGIIIILLLLICSGSIFIYFYFDNKIKVKEKKYDELSQTFRDVDNKYTEVKEKLKEIKQNIDDYTNTSEATSLLKGEYFKIAKEFEIKVKNKKTDKKIAYITFDDGPYYNTYKVLNILNKYDVRATFFTITASGQYCFDNKAEDCYKLYKEYLKKGHTIANHTYTHAIFNGLYNNNDSFMNAIIKQEEHIKNQTGGYIPNILRFPGGVPTAKAKGLDDSIFDRLRERGYGWIDWTAEDGDGKGINSKEQAWNNLIPTIDEDIEVILFHDYNNYTTQILPDVIEYLRSNNYVILPLFYESDMINK